MSVNYINLSLLLIILLISIIIIIYHTKRNYYLDDNYNSNRSITLLENNKVIIENFENKCNLKIKIIKIAVDENNKRYIKIEGRNLNKINGIFFGNIKLDISDPKTLKRISKRKVYLYPPDFNSKIYKNLIYDRTGEINLELRLLIGDKIDGLDDNGKKTKQVINMVFPTNLYYRTVGTKWTLFYGPRIDDSKNIENIEYHPVKNFKNQFTDIIRKEEATTYEYRVTNFKVDFDEKDETQTKITWQIPNMVSNENFAFILNITPLGNNSIDKFSVENEILPFNKTSYSFSNNKLLPMKTYQIKFETLGYKPIRKIKEGSEIKYNYVFKPKNSEDYHSHLYDPTTGKFNFYLGMDNDKLIQTYYELMAYNKNKSLKDLLEHVKKYNLVSTDLKTNIDKIIDGDHLDGFDKEVLEHIKKNASTENDDFVKNQEKQNDKINRINYKINILDKLKNKKKEKEDLTIKSLTSYSNGTILRLQDLGNLKKLVLLNNGCLAFDKNNLGKIDNIGYIPCNMLDKEQQFLVKRINSIEEYDMLMSLNLEESITVDSKKHFKPFYILQPIGTNKCVHINNKNLSIQNCKETDDIKFKGNFAGSKCNI